MSVIKELEDFYSPEKELPKEILKDEQNSKYFEGTVRYTDIKNSEYIKSINDKGEEIGRIFLDKNKKEKYVEIFYNAKMNVLGISSNITFLHSFSNNEKQNYNPNEFIGFRYYINGLKKSGKFFTLIKKNYSKYFILEKNEAVKDMDNKPFYDENLNCYEIIRSIFITKFKSKIIGDFGETFPEIIGFCMSLVTLNHKYFKFVEPLIANINTKNSIMDSIPEKINDEYIYIEQFIYDGHVSLIISSKAKDNARYNIILDMSHYHFKKEIPDLIFLPKSLKEKNIIYPQKPIQEYSSCCLWLFGEIECLLKYKKYSTFKSIFFNLRNGVDFYIDIVNLLSYEIDGIHSLIQKENERYDENNINKIDFSRIWIEKGKQFYSIHKDIVYSKFLNIEKLFLDIGIFIYLGEITILSRCQEKVSCIYELRNKLDLNLKYYDFLPQNDDILKGMEILMQYSETIDKLIKNFKKEYDIAFYQANILSYVGEIKDLTSKTDKLDTEMKKKIYLFDFDNFMRTIYNNYSVNKNEIENRLRLFSDETISKEINSLNDICFNIMNK